MNKYPLDNKGIENIVLDIQQNYITQSEIIANLYSFLCNAMKYVEHGTQEDWIPRAKALMKDLNVRKSTFENLRFDQSNGHRINESEPGVWPPLQSQSVGNEEMSEAELAAHFNLPPPPEPVEVNVKEMTLEEIESWEKSQDNSNDIYKVNARIKNLARSGGAVLTPTGEMLCSLYTHVMLAFYDFANKIENREIKIKLIDLIKENEKMPANMIAAWAANVKAEK
jgi:hypothetical protein